jgi:hypothetical protein
MARINAHFCAQLGHFAALHDCQVVKNGPPFLVLAATML